MSLLIIFELLLASCTAKKPCPEESVTYLEDASQFPSETDSLTPKKPAIEIRGKTVSVDRAIPAPLCYDTWEGMIIVA